MNKFLRILRWFFSSILGIFLTLLIFVGLFASSVSTTLKNPDNLKNWLSKGEVYQNLPATVGKLIQSQDDMGGNEIPLGEEMVDTTTTEVLEPHWLE
ncbi:MAG: hypothetical protein U9M98_03215 [Patescibacteria group bacterium]|nr:hypothetical protein [Patescibacteria group bacterium]